MSEESKLSPTTGIPLGEISQAPPALEVFLDKHQSKLIILTSVLALVAVIYVIFDGLKTSAEQEAGGLLSKAEDMADLQTIAKDHQKTAAAISAKVLLADKQWQDGQQDEAISTLNSIVSSSEKHPAMVSAKASLAGKLLSQGKKDEAFTLYSELSEDLTSTYIAPLALLALSDIEASKGNIQQAEKFLATINSDYEGTTFASDAKTRSLLLKAKMPIEVAAPVVAPEVKIPGDGDKIDLSQELKAGDFLDAAKSAMPNPVIEETPKSE